MKGRCPRPLDDGDLRSGLRSGGDKRDRTADLLHAMQALSQLSYTPERWESIPAPRFPVKKTDIKQDTDLDGAALFLYPLALTLH